jgi:hypothetical protein
MLLDEYILDRFFRLHQVLGGDRPGREARMQQIKRNKPAARPMTWIDRLYRP